VERVERALSVSPHERHEEIDGVEGYIVFLSPYTPAALMVCTKVGNVIYVLHTDWVRWSKMNQARARGRRIGRGFPNRSPRELVQEGRGGARGRPHGPTARPESLFALVTLSENRGILRRDLRVPSGPKATASVDRKSSNSVHLFGPWQGAGVREDGQKRPRRSSSVPLAGIRSLSRIVRLAFNIHLRCGPFFGPYSSTDVKVSARNFAVRL
jgi:hypothetical protein